MLLFGQRSGDRPIYPRRRASLRLVETAEDLPTRRRSAISGGNLRVAIGDVAPVERVMPPLLAADRGTILVDEGEPVASNVDVMIAEI
jgi:DNA-binding transcriptional LysR family regulator